METTRRKGMQNARKAKKMTQKQLAEKLGLATGTIQQYELGKRNPSRKTFEKIAEILDVSPMDIVGDGDEVYLRWVEVDDGVYVDSDDKIYIDAIKPYLPDLEPLSGKEDALRTLLNEMGYNILKARGRYFFSYGDGGSEISTDDLNELFNCAQNGLKVAAKTLELKLMQETLASFSRAETAPESASAPPEGKDTTPAPDAPETPQEGE